ncbi:hypothetical protein ACSNN7_12280 [Micromonospora sp. URMC 105]|uniref:hypothetical protein n=1 Tax=Micromonospora sp. URMC 105 TaxID=3423413 RepID=UPI003F1AF9AC
MRKFRTLLGATLAGACAITAVPGVASAAPAAPQSSAALAGEATGTYYPLAPARLMDTRAGLGAPKAKIGAQSKVDLQVTGRGGVPSTGVGSVVLNVTITGATANSFVTTYPAGEPLPNASSVNFAKGWLGSNSVTVKVGAGGKISVYNRNGATDVVVDVVGWYADDTSAAVAGGQYHPFYPSRMFDTREPGEGKLPAGAWIDYAIDFGEENQNLRSLVLNVTVAAPEKAGFVTVWSGSGSRPTASTVNYGAGKVVPNLTYVKPRPCTEAWCEGAPVFRVYTSATTHVITDLVGAMFDTTVPYGLRFQPMSPTRIVDSRINQGISGPLGAGSVRKVTTPAELITDATWALAMNVTAVQPTRNTVITTWPADYADRPKPDASNLNPAAGQVVSGGVLTEIGPYKAFNVHNHSGSVNLVADVVGSFYLPEVTAAAGRTAKPAATSPQVDTHSRRQP